ncbi:GTP-binding protein [Nocardioides speluncae]|uniref:GTP-binding protein n=1 Tax=Nocardioides speluncae TaxID=2670337 RepID=UPI000D68F9A4|nr:GTP-binding protein [Nocardioides speluncae]
MTDTTTRLPLVVLCGSNRESQAVAAMSLALELPQPVVVRHEIELEVGFIRRVVSDGTGVVEDVRVPVEHACLTCALRYEIVPTMVRLAEEAGGRWSSAVLDLPDSAEVVPVVRALRHMVVRGRPAGRYVDVRSVLAAVTGETLVGDVFGDDLVRERGGPEYDDRTVGGVICDQLEYADIVLCTDEALPDDAAALLGELCRPGVQVTAEPGDLAAARLLAVRDHDAADAAVELTGRVPGGERPNGEIVDVTRDPDGGMWTLAVDTWRPFHPRRLLDRIEDIGGHGVRSRGCFWLPTRPLALNAWDGAGGALAIGTSGLWQEREPRTRILITGLGDGRDAVARAVEDVLMSEAELARGLARWAGRDDDFDAWLGSYSEVA